MHQSSRLSLFLFALQIHLGSAQLPFYNTSKQINDYYHQDCVAIKSLYSSLGGSYSLGDYNCCNWNFVSCANMSQVTFVTASRRYPTLTGCYNCGNPYGPDKFDNQLCARSSRDAYCSVSPAEYNVANHGTFKVNNGIIWTYSCNTTLCTVSSPPRPQVTSVYWRKQGFTGTLSPAVKTLTGMRVLSLSDNRIRGRIPPEIGELASLEGLELDGNSFTGRIPSTIARLSRLSRLALSNNMLSGTLPYEIIDMKSLKNIELDGNRLSGRIPPGIFNLPNLSVLNLDKNILSGAILSSNMNPTSPLTQLSLGGNSFTDVIPTVIGIFKNLTYLSLEGNKLEGSIPSSIANLQSLDVFELSGNQLNGTIPSEIATLTSLTQLDLSNNKFVGAFPKQIVGLKDLLYLRIENNLFSSIPSEVSNMTSTVSIVLPNPLSTVSQRLAAQNPSFTLSSGDWEKLVNTSSSLEKRQQYSTSTDLTPDQLYSLCPLNDVTNPNVAAGCVAGIYQKYCANLPPTFAAYSRCQNTYDKVFDLSIFKPLGDVCPAWRDGPRSAACMRAVSTFSVNLGYIVVNSQMAGQLVSNIFGSRLYAPCIDFQGIVCRW